MPDEPTKIDRLKQLILDRKKNKQDMLDNRYQDLQEYTESQQERDERILKNNSAWAKL